MNVRGDGRKKIPNTWWKPPTQPLLKAITTRLFKTLGWIQRSVYPIQIKEREICVDKCTGF